MGDEHDLGVARVEAFERRQGRLPVVVEAMLTEPPAGH
jgi:hypothetical protein